MACILPVPPTLADRLAKACWYGDISSAQAVVAEGASLNDKAMTPIGSHWVPLVTAVYRKHHDVAVWLLSQGADPNGPEVMYHCAYYTTGSILQLLVDAGGDVNYRTYGDVPLLDAVRSKLYEETVPVLLAEPSLDFAAAPKDCVFTQFARVWDRPAVAVMIAIERARRSTLSPDDMKREQRAVDDAAIARLFSAGLGHLRTPSMFRRARAALGSI